MISRTRSRIAASNPSRREPSWSTTLSVLVFTMAYSSCALNLLLRDSGLLLSLTSQENTPSTFLQESRQNHQNFDHDYFFKLPLQGAGCPITSAVCYFPPCRFSSCPAYEPNSNEGEYSQPFRHIQYKRIAILRPIATLAMLLCLRIAKRMYRRRQCGL